MIGEKYGKLTVLKEVEKFTQPSGQTQRGYLCKCECGNETVVCAMSLRLGRTKSCGCLRNERSRINAITHGHNVGRVRSPEYTCWANMKRRCYTESARGYKHWGGRGIKVCKRWRDSFPAFLKDMGRKPSPDLSLDRIDNDGNYEPGNCRWATKKQQRNNRRQKLSCST